MKHNTLWFKKASIIAQKHFSFISPKTNRKRVNHPFFTEDYVQSLRFSGPGPLSRYSWISIGVSFFQAMATPVCMQESSAHNIMNMTNYFFIALFILSLSGCTSTEDDKAADSDRVPGTAGSAGWCTRTSHHPQRPHDSRGAGYRQDAWHLVRDEVVHQYGAGSAD